MLSNFSTYFGQSTNSTSGWNPAYTLATVLMQLASFFADPDLPKDCLPTTEQIEQLKSKSGKFSCPSCPTQISAQMAEIKIQDSPPLIDL